jgi:hypothetical protein
LQSKNSILQPLFPKLQVQNRNFRQISALS